MYAFVYDLKRFALYNCSGIEQTPLQIYCGAFVFAPESSIIRGNVKSRVPGWVRRLPKVPNGWNALMQILEGHAAIITVAFSPECKQLASASYDDTIRLWDTASGMALQTLKGHSSHVCAVAYSRMASCWRRHQTTRQCGCGTRPQELGYRRSKTILTGLSLSRSRQTVSG